jgi:hypothetical protein
MKYEDVVGPLSLRLAVLRSERLLDRANRWGLSLRDVVDDVETVWHITDRGRYLGSDVAKELKKLILQAEGAHRKEMRERLSLWLAFIFGAVGAFSTLYTLFHSSSRVDALSERVRQLELTIKTNKSAERPEK